MHSKNGETDTLYLRPAPPIFVRTAKDASLALRACTFYVQVPNVVKNNNTVCMAIIYNSYVEPLPLLYTRVIQSLYIYTLSILRISRHSLAPYVYTSSL